jgi:hypothetical protein
MNGIVYIRILTEARISTTNNEKSRIRWFGLERIQRTALHMKIKTKHTIIKRLNRGVQTDQWLHVRERWVKIRKDT